MVELLELEVVFKKAARKSDDSVNLTFETTQELSTEQFSVVDGFRKQNGHLLFKKDAISLKEIPTGNTSGEAQSPSQALRSSLYAVWKAKTDNGTINEGWDTYYDNAMRGFKRAVDKSHPEND